MPAIIRDFLRDHPQVQAIDLLLPDMNGILRGKRIDATQTAKAFDEGILLPRSVYACDVRGDTVEASGLGIASGDRDLVCRPQVDTLRPVPWGGGETAQCLMEMVDEHGGAFDCSPRHVLREVVAALHALGLYPTVAVEMEFYLFRRELDGAGYPQLVLDPASGRELHSTQVYSMDELDNFAPFMDSVRRYAQTQSVPASAATAEYAPGQFEINLAHKDDPMGACDDATYLKRIVRSAAREHDMLASFMAKPMSGITGSGTHIHVSLCDVRGRNLFAAEPQRLQQAVGGLQQTMAEAMLMFAPHANSYRRFQRKAYVPLSPSWGYNNRTVALRIPAGPDEATRIEHRVAGADANPYLVMAAVLGGILHGCRTGCVPDLPIEGDAAEQCAPSLPTDWHDAITRLRASEWATGQFGAPFVELYTTIKQAEYEAFQREIPPLDVSWYLQTV